MTSRLCRLLILSVSILLPGASLAAPLPAVTPNGILAERALPLAHYEDLDGRPAPRPRGWPAGGRPCTSCGARPTGPRLAVRPPGPGRRPGQGGPRQVALALIHARYDRLDDQDRLEGAEVLALGALRQDIYHGADLGLELDPGRIFSHGTSPLAALTLDPDDGGGPGRCSPGCRWRCPTRPPACAP